jgi:hypothetical protein
VPFPLASGLMTSRPCIYSIAPLCWFVKGRSERWTFVLEGQQAVRTREEAVLWISPSYRSAARPPVAR